MRRIKTMQTIHEFIEKHQVKATATPADGNPNIEDSDWSAGASHYSVRLQAWGRSMTVRFSQGSAHTEPPTAYDVVWCLLQDLPYSGMDFSEFCSELGYDEDSRKAHRTWKAVQKQNERVKRFLGEHLEEAAEAVDE
jgi:hypothetical protein